MYKEYIPLCFMFFCLRGQATVAAEVSVSARAAHVTVLGRVFLADRPLKAVRLSFPSPPPLSSSISRNAAAVEASMVQRRWDGRSMNRNRGYVVVQAEGEVSRH